MTLISPGRGKKALINLSGDKSISHRLILMSLLNQGIIEIKNLSECKDVKTSLQLFTQLGGRIKILKDRIALHGTEKKLKTTNSIFDCKNSGTTTRLLCGILASQAGPFKLTGDSSLKKRPMERIIQPLKKMGVKFAENDSQLPLTIYGTPNLKSISYNLPVASAQVKSALLLAAIQAEGNSIIGNTGASRNHTENLLNFFGINFKDNSDSIEIYGKQKLEGSGLIVIPGDISTAAFYMVAAILIPGSDISLENVLLNSGRIEFAHILKQMGADIEFRPETSFIEAAGTIKVRYSPQLKAANICNDSIIKCIDELPVLAVAMSFAEGVSRIRDAMELRKKESDRITAICTALKEIGIKIRELPDGFEIVGNPDLVPYGTCKTFSDHRIAAALSIFALKSKSGIELDDIDCIDVSFPEFKNNFLPCFGSFV